MPQQTMFSVYGSGHVGSFGGIIKSTNVHEILQINCTIADFFANQKSYDTYLYFNPYDTTRSVTVIVKKESFMFIRPEHKKNHR